MGICGVVGLLLVFAGLHGDDVGTDRADGQRCGDPGDDVGVTVVAVQQQHLDQGPGAATVAVGVAGGGPERLMGAGEQPGGAGLDQGCRAGQRPGFAGQHLQVVVQVQALAASHGRAFVSGDLVSTFEEQQL